MRGFSVALALTGCYAPSAVAPCTATCDLATQPACPSGLECRGDGLCHTPGSDDCIAPRPDAGMDPITFTTNVMFVTSTTKAPMEFGGLKGADDWCMNAAKAGHLPTASYVAWLSASEGPMPTDAIDRLANSRGWVRPDGKPFVDSVTALAEGSILYPPRIDENGHELPESDAIVVTATRSTGRITGPACAGFTMDNGVSPGIGVAQATTELWTDTGEVVPCAKPAHIYCFGLGLEAPLVLPPPAGLRAFQSLATFAPDATSGPNAADTICNNEAVIHGLPPNFLAFLATASETAVHRVGSVGPWYRVDGVEIGSLADPTGTMPLAPEAPINVTAGMQYTFDNVWTGAATTVQVGTNASSCGSWLSMTPPTAVYGVASRADGGFFQSATSACTSRNHVYCMELPFP